MASEQSESLLYGSGRVGGGYADLASLIIDLQKNSLGLVQIAQATPIKKLHSTMEMPAQLPALMQRMLWIAAASKHECLRYKS